MEKIFFKLSAVLAMVIAFSIFSGTSCEAATSYKPLVVRKKILAPTDESGAYKDQGRSGLDQKITAIKPKSDISAALKAPVEEKFAAAEASTAANAVPLYDPKGKIDPFKPLFKETPKIQTKSATYADSGRKRTTDIEKIDLSQLRLTAIVVAASGNKALVQEASGRGHVVSKGTYIGTHGGRVAEVLKDRVIVKEKMKDVMGKLFFKKTELKLNKKNS